MNHFGPSRNMCFGVAEFPASKHAPEHMHTHQEEIIYVLSGEGEMYFDGIPESVKPGMCIYIPPEVRHSINNTSSVVMKVVYVFSPPVIQGSYDVSGSNAGGRT